MNHFTTKTRLVRAAMTLLMALLTTVPAWASVSSVNNTTASPAVQYIDENGTSQFCTSFTVVTSSIGTTWNEGWYVVDSNVQLSSRISVSGHVRLILVDGYALTVNGGIEINDPNSITIYGQSANSGKLTCEQVSSYCAALGSGRYQEENTSASRTYGDITINGGTINVTGGYWSAGIGAGSVRLNMTNNKPGGTITINNGNITATGGKAGPGIGSGHSSAPGTITINAGNITATAGGERIPAIGGSWYNGYGVININGGRITTNTEIYISNIYGCFPGVGTSDTGTLMTINLNWTRASDRYAFNVPIVLADEKKSDGCFGNKTYLKTFEKGWENNRQILVPHKGYTFHGKKDATCTENGYSRDCYQCPECGKYFTDNTVPTECDKSDVYLNPLGHNMEYTPEVAATFTSNGNIAYYHCQRCGKYFKDAAGKFEITLAETVTTAVTYLDENGVEQTLASGSSVTADNAVWSNGWYLVDHDVTFDARISVNGTVNLLLLNGKTLTANNGIEVKNGNTFRIYAQSTDENVMGKLIAALTSEDNFVYDSSTIGGSMSSHQKGGTTVNGRAGTIVINGGYLDVTGMGCFAIGDGEREYESNDEDYYYFSYSALSLTINGGVIDLKGGSYGSIGTQADGGNITINGGKITVGNGDLYKVGILCDRYGHLSINDTGRPLQLRSTFSLSQGTFKISGNLMLNDGTGTDAVVTANNYNFNTNFGDGVTTLVNYRTVTFDDFGTKTARKTPFGTAVDEPSHSSRPGYTFVGWAAGDALYDFSAAVTSDKTITAKYRDLTPFGYTASYTPDGSDSHPYLISNKDGWNAFCNALQDNVTWNRFSGQIVKLGADIGTAESPVTRAAGYASHDFCGIFDGQGNTITFSLSSSREYPAIFDHVSNADNVPAAIRNLKVVGTVTVNDNTSHKYAGGLVGGCWGVLDIENCRVSTVIDSRLKGDGTHGGIVGRQGGGTLNIRGCVFDGQMLGSDTYACAGIVGYRTSGATNIYNTLFAPKALTMSTDQSATFVRNATKSCHEGCYYTQSFGATTTESNAQGTQVYSITAGEDVTTLDINGTTTDSYIYSGLNFYSAGLKCDDVLYAAEGDEVRLKLEHSDQSDDDFIDYTASAGTLTANSPSGDGGAFYTLIMPNEQVAINIETFVNLQLSDTGANAGAIVENDKKRANVTLAGRTLYKDGGWNTLCLPFSVAIKGSPLDGAEARCLTEASITGTTLSLTFNDPITAPVTTLEAGTPYIIRWSSGDNLTQTDLVFHDVTIDKTDNSFDNGEDGDARVRFLGTYDAITFNDPNFTEDRSMLFLGGNNALYYPQVGVDEQSNPVYPSIGACRAYFKIGEDGAGARLLTGFNLNFGDGSEDTGIISISKESRSQGVADAWYTLDGVKVDGVGAGVLGDLQSPVPARLRKGLYIVNGKKVVIK